MNVLFVSSEVAPFSKTGGLADVAAALPAALASLGHEVKVVTPLYQMVKREDVKPLGKEIRLRFPFGTDVGSLHSAQVSPRHEVIFLSNPGYFDRPGIYGDMWGEYGDNHRRFAFLSIGALNAAQAIGFAPDVVHLNDWQTGLAAVALKRGFVGTVVGRAKSVFTIHNLAFTGSFSKEAMTDLGLPWDLFTTDGVEFYDRLSYMKAGLSYSDVLTTVSPTYAKEIQGPEAGNGLDGLLRRRAKNLHGILNGIDVKEWNPETDPYLPARYSAEDISGKELCKREALERLGLKFPPGKIEPPLFVFVSRLADQKGFDLLSDVLWRALEDDVLVAGVGSGDFGIEQGLKELTYRFPGRVGLKLGYDNALAHLLEAGGDFFLMPSRFEPCGLNQMYSLRYGTVPVVRATGGLQDTVTDLADGEGTGIKFREYQSQALLHAIGRARELYANRRQLSEVRRRGMKQDFSWETSAKKYEALYRSL
ncbi:MAG: glycogen synthase GlgA [Myxococcaceae bacterium]